MRKQIYPHKYNVLGICEKCGTGARESHLVDPICPIADDEDELRCADVEAELSTGYPQ